MTISDYVARVWNRISRGAPQPVSGIWREAIQVSIPTALQRLADKVAADDSLYPLLMGITTVTLGSGSTGVPGTIFIHEIPFPGLLISKAAQSRIRIERVDGDDPNLTHVLRKRETLYDLLNLPPIPDLEQYYCFSAGRLWVRQSDGAGGTILPTNTDLTVYGCFVPLLSDDVIDLELSDDLIDIGAAMAVEDASVMEAVRQAEKTSAVVPALGAPQ